MPVAPVGKVVMMSPGLPAGNGAGGTYRAASEAAIGKRPAVVVAVVTTVVDVVAGVGGIVVGVAIVVITAAVFGGIALVSVVPAEFVLEQAATRSTRTDTAARRRMAERYPLSGERGPSSGPVIGRMT
jgi:hypothetical protein